MRRSGFTLLEVLVASVLMGMLVTILTMIFNQSAIAWRTGKAGVADMTDTERQLSRIRAEQNANRQNRKDCGDKRYARRAKERESRARSPLSLK